MWSLTTVDPAAPSWSLPTAPGRVAIGRAPKGAGLVVPAAYKAVSQEHGRFDVTANTLSFTDTSSRGSSLNGAVQLAKVPAAAPAVSTAALQSGDVLVLGGAEGEDPRGGCYLTPRLKITTTAPSEAKQPAAIHSAV